ncbi:hypothetical protein ACIQ9P_26840 [Kitasatospora sp. NPDC094019]|uniref:hypothetical protein n=1 Tax=Kitasatospora sp. NPDC094019 TaxID=3364091 RepID=UPI0038205B9A
MTDRRTLTMPFSEPATDAAVPARSGGRLPSPVEQGADFRQPPGETAAVSVPPRRPLAAGGLTFSDPARRA